MGYDTGGPLVVFLVVGLVLSVGGTVDVLRQAETIQSAERTQGTVTSFDTYRIEVRDGDDSYGVTVNYQYTVDNETYGARTLRARYATDMLVSNFVKMNDRPNRITVDRRKQTWKYGSRFREGKSVTVYYDPRNPSSSFLLRWYSIWPYLVALAGAFSLSLGPLPRAIRGTLGRFERWVEPDESAVADDATPGVDVPVLSSLDLSAVAVERAASYVVWGGLLVGLLWYAAHYSASGNLLGTAIVGGTSLATFVICYYASLEDAGSDADSGSEVDPDES